MKQHWKTVERDQRKKREKELADQARMYEYYEGAQGDKAKEIQKRAEALEDELNDCDMRKREIIARSEMKVALLHEERDHRDKTRRERNSKSYATVMDRIAE